MLWLVVTSVLTVLPGAAQEEHHHAALEAAAAESSQVGLDEKPGAFVPLDAAFRDETGKEVTLGELIDRPTIIAPVYYHCSNVCNFLQAGLARALPEVKLSPGEDFQVLSVSFDETETPELARKIKHTHITSMAGRFPPDAWHFLTGDLNSIRRLTEAAGYGFQRQGVDFLHPVAIFIVTPDGKIVRYLHGTSFLPMDLTLALMEASEGRVGATIRKVASFCFSYDPENKTYVFNLLRVSATVVFLTAAGFLAFLILGGRKKNHH